MSYYVITYDTKEEGDYRRNIIQFILTNGGRNLKYSMKTTITFTSNKPFLGTGNWKELFSSLKGDIHYYVAKIETSKQENPLQDNHFTRQDDIDSFNEIRDEEMTKLGL